MGNYVRIVKITEHDYGTFVSSEMPMDTQWPAGDPCPKDKETLVMFQERVYRGNTQEKD